MVNKRYALGSQNAHQANHHLLFLTSTSYILQLTNYTLSHEAVIQSGGSVLAGASEGSRGSRTGSVIGHRLLLNFGAQSLEFKRVHNNRPNLD